MHVIKLWTKNENWWLIFKINIYIKLNYMIIYWYLYKENIKLIIIDAF